MKPVNKHYENMANTLMPQFEKRRFQSFYCPDKESALQKALELVPQGSVVSHGGSESIIEIGLLDAIKSGNYTYVNRKDGSTPEELRESAMKSIFSDYYLMSSNAVTIKGELVNIDGAGNRVAALAFGPKNVILIVGMNKICKDIDEAIWRAQNIASPKNTLRLSKDTPCAKIGVCGNCFGDDSICSTITVTRRSMEVGRVKIILVGENLGY